MTRFVPAPFEDGPLVVHYSGTFGLAHEEHTITEAMRQLRDDSRFRFVFVGGGARRERVGRVLSSGRDSQQPSSDLTQDALS